MALPILKIIWAKTDPGPHGDHLHVEGIPKRTGTPPRNNPGMTPSIKIIFDALVQEYGTPAYFLDWDAVVDSDWTYMGGWNRRPIGKGTTWSQHAWWNGLDIGPYYGVKNQQRFYDFLTGKIQEVDMSQFGPEKWDEADWKKFDERGGKAVMTSWLTDPEGVAPGVEGNPYTQKAFHYHTGFRKMRSDTDDLKSDVKALSQKVDSLETGGGVQIPTAAEIASQIIEQLKP